MERLSPVERYVCIVCDTIYVILFYFSKLTARSCVHVRPGAWIGL